MRLLLIFIISIAWAQDWKVQKQNWNGVDVTWLEDEQFPTYQIIFYFAEGALSDHKIRSGETEALFDLLQSGTNSYTKDQIASSFEFYGVRVEPSVTHEYSTLEVRGMIQDMIPTTKLVCHLLNKTTFANKEVNLYTKKKKAFLGNLAAHPRELADRAFREISLAKTPLSRPSSGKLKALGNLSSSRLRDKLSLLNTKVSKRIYIRGPKQLLNLKTIIKNDCGWGKVEKPKASYVASNAIVKNPGIYFVKVPRSSISHIRIGKTLKKSKKDEQTYLASMQLGGGFTSTLMERLRTQEGLVYGADLRSHYQANYGRTILSTETSSSKTLKVLEAIESTLTSAAKAETPQQLDKVKTFARGQYLLAMDDKNQILKQIVHYEHRGKTVQDLKKFIEKTALVSEKDVLQEYRKHFRWDDQTIVILGTEKTLKKLRKKYKNIRVYQYKKFL